MTTSSRIMITSSGGDQGQRSNGADDGNGKVGDRKGQAVGLPRGFIEMSNIPGDNVAGKRAVNAEVALGLEIALALAGNSQHGVGARRRPGGSRFWLRRRS